MTDLQASQKEPHPGTLEAEAALADLARITASPTVMMGKPVVRGTRITVEHVLDELAGGLSIDDP
jgi:uncharacterized protein (DUF433 family)